VLTALWKRKKWGCSNTSTHCRLIQLIRMAKTGSPLSCSNLANSCTCSSKMSYQQNHYKWHLTWNIHGLIDGPLLSWTLCIWCLFNISLEWGMSLAKFVERMKTHFMFSKFFSENNAFYEIMWKNGRAREATIDITIRSRKDAICMPE
jgi:hypothetical protein